MIFVDSNVILDIFARDSTWYDWSRDELARAIEVGRVFVSAIVVAELSRNFDSLEELRAKLTRLSLTTVVLDDECAFLAGHRFASYRQVAERPRTRVLADFMIGAHAVSKGSSLLTRDPSIYRRYFPELTLITPKTDNG